MCPRSVEWETGGRRQKLCELSTCDKRMDERLDGGTFQESLDDLFALLVYLPT